MSNETKSKNEVIARWMGWKQVLNSELWHHETPPLWCTNIQGKLYFDTSFDWIMPVVKKCLDTNFGNDFDKWRELSYRITQSLQLCDCELTRDKVYDFIEWYNTVTKGEQSK